MPQARCDWDVRGTGNGVRWGSDTARVLGEASVWDGGAREAAGLDEPHGVHCAAMCKCHAYMCRPMCVPCVLVVHVRVHLHHVGVHVCSCLSCGCSVHAYVRLCLSCRHTCMLVIHVHVWLCTCPHGLSSLYLFTQ